MNDKTTYYEGLIAAYFSGEATPDEIRELSVWLTENASNLNLFEDYRKTWLLTISENNSKNIDIQTEWEAMLLKTELKHHNSPTLPQSKSRLIHFVTSWKAAAILVLLFVSAAVLYYLNSGNEMIRATAEVNNTEILLPDGSVITLKKGTTLEYPESFTSETREVSLTGEAYFEVAHDASKPFIVAGNEARIEVLGTSFNVNNRTENGSINVVLTSGRVSLYFRGNKSNARVLNPGEKAVMLPGKKIIETTSNTDPNYMAWKTGTIVFEETDLSQVARTLGDIYDTEIRLENQELLNCKLTATFEKQSLEQVLNVIATTLELRYKQSGSLVIFEGSSCR